MKIPSEVRNALVKLGYKGLRLKEKKVNFLLANK